MSSPISSSRLSSSTPDSTSLEESLPVSSRAAKPQTVSGVQVWPEHWGITHQQIYALLSRLKQDPLWRSDNNVYTLVSEFLIPWTRGTGVGYALLVNQTAFQEVNVMVSHAWSENAEDFLQAVLRATTEGDVCYICALANYQAEDGKGPSIEDQIGSESKENPFRRILQHIANRGKLEGWIWRLLLPWLELLPDFLVLAGMLILLAPVIAHMMKNELFQMQPSMKEVRRELWLSWLKCTACLWITAAAIHVWLRRCSCIYSGRMLLVPNRENDIYSRLWCVYEIFIAKLLNVRVRLAPTMAPAGNVNSQDAVCGSADDQLRIRAEIAASRYGYHDIDIAVSQTMREKNRYALGLWVKYVILLAGPTAGGPHQYFVLIPPFVAMYAGMIALVYYVANHNHGVFCVNYNTVNCSLLVITIRSLFTAIMSLFFLWDALWAPWVDVITIEASTVAVVFMAALLRPYPACLNAHYRVGMIILLFVLRFSSKLGLEMWIDGKVFNVSQTVRHSWFAYSLTAPIYMIWTGSQQWGMKLKSGNIAAGTASLLAWMGVFVFLAGSFLRLDIWVCYFTGYFESSRR